MPDPIAIEISRERADVLRRRGLPEGAAIVERDEVIWWDQVYSRSPTGLYVPEALDPIERYIPQPEPRPVPVACDLFAGAGGFSLGFHWAGIDTVCAVESWPIAAITYLGNLGHPDCEIRFDGPETEAAWRKGVVRARKRRQKGQPDAGAVQDGPLWGDLEDRSWIGSACRAAEGFEGGCRAMFCGDIRNTTGQELLEFAGVERFDVVMGGPPCQGLSTANAKACIEDPRNAMLWEFLRIVEEANPRAFLIENVPPLLRVANGALFEALAEKANAAGYDVVANVLDASNYGVPQYRRRALIQGTAHGETRHYTFPMPTTWPVVRSVDGQDFNIGGDHRRGGGRAVAAIFHDKRGLWVRPEYSAAVEPPPDPQPDLFGEEHDAA